MKRAGFTLIELLVVIGIILLMMAVLTATIGVTQDTFHLHTCKIRMHQLHGLVKNHEANRGRYPAGGGSRFLYELWAGQPNRDTRDLMFCPECVKFGAHADVLERPAKDVWRTPEEFTEDQTDWVTASAKHKRSWGDPDEIVLADKTPANHGDRAINVMYGTGRTETIFVRDLVRKGILEEGETLRVGEDSQLESLRKLTSK